MISNHYCYVPKNFREQSRLLIKLAKGIIEEYSAKGMDLTLRQLYYQFVARGYIENSERSYKNIGSLVSDARLAGELPWDSIVDRTRHMRLNEHWNDPAAMVKDLADTFSTDKWARQPKAVQVWVEKEALVGVLDNVCPDLDTTYFACKGYVSQSAMWRAAEAIKYRARKGQKTIILHLGDHDPSGIDMTRDIDDRLRVFQCYARTTGEPYWEVQRIALNMDQIEEHQPPPNPAKLSDSRAATYVQEYGYESWELDALDPETLIALIQHHVGEIRDQQLWDAAVQEETTAREELVAMMAEYEDLREMMPRLQELKDHFAYLEESEGE